MQVQFSKLIEKSLAQSVLFLEQFNVLPYKYVDNAVNCNI